MVDHDSRNIGSLALEFINSTNRNIFLTGGAGTGKTTFLKFLKQNISKKIAIAAPTGVAAVNAGGTTIHSLFSLPPRKLDDQTVKNIRLSAQSKDLLRELDLLVIDEASMLRADVLDVIDFILRDVRKSDLPIGGLQLVLIGDLFQLPPFEFFGEKDETNSGYKNQYFTNARVFPALKIAKLEMTKVHRQTEGHFIDLLNAVRNGQLSDGQLHELNTHYDVNWEGKISTIILTTHNRYSIELNNRKIDSLPGDAMVFMAEITGDFPEDYFPVEEELRLKIDCLVMIVKNDVSGNKAFFNGKIGKVIAISDDSVTVAFEDNSVSILEKETWFNIDYQVQGDTGTLREEVKGTFKQFPLKFGWAITVHKSQGLTFDKAVIDVAEAFAPGQVYVALSRVKSLAGITLKSKIPRKAIIAPSFDTSAFPVFTPIEMERILTADKMSYFLNIAKTTYEFSNLNKFLSQIALPDSMSETVQQGLLKFQNWGTKFVIELGSKLVPDLIPDWNFIKDRIGQACLFFKREIENACILPLKDFENEHKNDFFYRASVNASKSLIKLFRLKLKDIQAIDAVLVSITKPVNYQPVIYPSNKAQHMDIASASPIKTRSFITTEEQTLELFLEGKSLKDISQLRGLGEPAIQYHLASFIPTGEVKIQDIIPLELLAETLAVVAKLDDWSVAKLRPLVGDRLSIGQLHSLVIYFKSR